jgi:antirestriction protein ArdC
MARRESLNLSSSATRTFNLSQTENIDLPASALQETRTNNPIEDCERIVAEMPSRPAFEQSDKASYSPSRDVVRMPSIGLFCSSEEYYSSGLVANRAF